MSLALLAITCQVAEELPAACCLSSSSSSRFCNAIVVCHRRHHPGNRMDLQKPGPNFAIHEVSLTPEFCLQDVSGGKPVRVGDSDLWGMEIDVEAAAEEIRSIGKADKGKNVDEVLGSFGLGAFAEQLKDLRLSAYHDLLMLYVSNRKQHLQGGQHRGL